MKIELLIADDHELRAAVRDLIKAEVTNIARTEIRQILAEVAGEKIATNEKIDILIKSELSSIVRSSLQANGNSDSYIRSLAREEVNKVIGSLWANRPQGPQV